MRRMPRTKRRRITRNKENGLHGDGRSNSQCVISRLDRKPDRQRDDSDNDATPHHRREAFRTTASRRVVGGVVEFSIHEARLTEDRQHLVPQRGSPVSIMFGRRRLRRADGIGCRKAVNQTGLQFGVDAPGRQAPLRENWRHACRVAQDRISQPCLTSRVRQRVGNSDVPIGCGGTRPRLSITSPVSTHSRGGFASAGSRGCRRYFRHMVNIAQTGAATSGGLWLR
jgi:hypothetical protein